LTEIEDNTLPSKRPYMLRAMWEWCMDAGLTPQILVDARVDGVDVPREFVKDGTIVLNVHDRAVRSLDMNNDAISFSARFAGQPRSLFVPVDAVLAIYARENGQGLFFEVPAEEESSGDSGATAEDKVGASVDVEGPRRGKPNLKLV
jgi:stringent starvation protein B